MPALRRKEATLWMDESVRNAGKLGPVARELPRLMKKLEKPEMKEWIRQAMRLNQKEPTEGMRVKKTDGVLKKGSRDSGR